MRLLHECSACVNPPWTWPMPSHLLCVSGAGGNGANNFNNISPKRHAHSPLPQPLLLRTPPEVRSRVYKGLCVCFWYMYSIIVRVLFTNTSHTHKRRPSASSFACAREIQLNKFTKMNCERLMSVEGEDWCAFQSLYYVHIY